MNDDVKRRLAESLTFAGTTDIIPFLPYLLQDFWDLGSDPMEMEKLMLSRTSFGQECRILDLACGKGAVSVGLTKRFGCTAKGIDLIPEFIEEAIEKAAEHGVSSRCSFVVGDVNEAVNTEQGYDLVVWGAAGDLLGSYPATIAGIVRTINPGGYILLDDAYIPSKQHHLRFHHNYLLKEEWEQVFKDNELKVLAVHETPPEVNPSAYAQELDNIRKRAEELAQQYPDKRGMFESYVLSQQAEYEDLQDGMVPALWLLQKNR